MTAPKIKFTGPTTNIGSLVAIAKRRLEKLREQLKYRGPIFRSRLDLPNGAINFLVRESGIDEIRIKAPAPALALPYQRPWRLLLSTSGGVTIDDQLRVSLVDTAASSGAPFALTNARFAYHDNILWSGGTLAFDVLEESPLRRFNGVFHESVLITYRGEPIATQEAPLAERTASLLDLLEINGTLYALFFVDDSGPGSIEANFPIYTWNKTTQEWVFVSEASTEDGIFLAALHSGGSPGVVHQSPVSSDAAFAGLVTSAVHLAGTNTTVFIGGKHDPAVGNPEYYSYGFVLDDAAQDDFVDGSLILSGGAEPGFAAYEWSSVWFRSLGFSSGFFAEGDIVFAPKFANAKGAAYNDEAYVGVDRMGAFDHPNDLAPAWSGLAKTTGSGFTQLIELDIRPGSVHAFDDWLVVGDPTDLLAEIDGEAVWNSGHFFWAPDCQQEVATIDALGAGGDTFTLTINGQSVSYLSRPTDSVGSVTIFLVQAANESFNTEFAKVAFTRREQSGGGQVSNRIRVVSLSAEFTFVPTLSVSGGNGGMVTDFVEASEKYFWPNYLSNVVKPSRMVQLAGGPVPIISSVALNGIVDSPVLAPGASYTKQLESISGEVLRWGLAEDKGEDVAERWEMHTQDFSLGHDNAYVVTIGGTSVSVAGDTSDFITMQNLAAALNAAFTDMTWTPSFPGQYSTDEFGTSFGVDWGVTGVGSEGVPFQPHFSVTGPGGAVVRPARRLVPAKYAHPEGLTIDETGLVSWVPVDLGDHSSPLSITALAANAAGWGTAHIQAYIPPTAPVVQAIPSVSISGTSYSRRAYVTAGDLNTVTWSLDEAPVGTIVSRYGLVSVTGLSDGVHAFTLRATNAKGADTVSWSVTVA